MGMTKSQIFDALAQKTEMSKKRTMTRTNRHQDAKTRSESFLLIMLCAFVPSWLKNRFIPLAPGNAVLQDRPARKTAAADN